MKTEYEWLRHSWNTSYRLKEAVKRLGRKGISKDTVVNFWKKTSREIGYSNDIKVPIKPRRPQSRDDIIKEYSSYIGGIFGPTYADWCATSVNSELIKAGYEP